MLLKTKLPSFWQYVCHHNFTITLTGPLYCRTVFVVGATQDKAQQEKLDEEARTHGDIIQYNFIDSYA